MKRLILMRHAKSDWSSGVTLDHDRPLNDRGQRSAKALGSWLQERGLIPDQVLCSSAARTSETLLRLALPEGLNVTFTRDLYLAPPAAILQALRGATGATVLMLGHNPGIAEAAEDVLQDPPDTAQFQKYPTGATLVADFDIEDWSTADWGMARLAHFVVPRDLI